MIVMIICGITGAIALWALYQNERTSRQRMRILTHIGSFMGGANFKLYLSGFQVVSYEQHLWARCILRDPMKLYPEIIQDLIRNDR